MATRVVWLTVLTLAVATAASASTLSLAPGSTLRLDGTSTLHPFSFTASELRVDGDIAARTPSRLVVEIPVAQLHSGESGLDKNMRKSLKADQVPDIRFELTGFQIDSTGTDSTVGITAQGRLSIAGVTRAIALQAGCRYGADAVRARGQKELLMTDFGVKPPTMMMGTIRTGDKVTVHFDLNLVEKADSIQAGKEGAR